MCDKTATQALQGVNPKTSRKRSMMLSNDVVGVTDGTSAEQGVGGQNLGGGEDRWEAEPGARAFTCLLLLVPQVHRREAQW